MKPAILITSHPNTKKKEQILKDFGSFISQYGIDHYLVSNYPSDKETQKEFKGTFYYNNNPLGPFRGNVWTTFPKVEKTYVQIIPNWTYSFMLLLLNGVKNLKNLGYTHFIYFAYDSSPDLDLIKNYINLSIKNFENNKSIFTEYELDWKDSLSSTTCSCEIDLFIEIFENNLEEYLKGKLPTLCEQFWYSSIIPFKDNINILPKTQAIPTVFASAESNHIFPSGKYYVGYDKSSKDIIIITDNTNLQLFDSNQNLVDTILLNNNSKSPHFPGEFYVYKFLPLENEEYFVSDHLLFKNTLMFRNTNFYNPSKK